MTKTIIHIATSILPLLEGRLRGGELRSGWRGGVRLMSWGWVFGVLLTLFLTTGTQGALAQTTVYGNVFYEQTYEAPDGTSIGADWTTSVNGRFTPTILEEGGNHFMAANPTQTYNNGATLTGPNINVAADKTYVLSFDLRLRKSSSDAQKPEFYITNAAGTKFFNLVAKDGTNNATWVLNGSTDITLTGTEYDNSNIVDDLHWFRFKLVWDGTNMKLTITDMGTDFSSSTSVLAEPNISPLDAGKGIGNMVFASGRTLAKFAIDNIRVTSLFSYSSESVAVDITSVGTADRPDKSSLMPTLVNEITGSVTETTYSSSDWNVARIEGGALYLTGIGTTSIGIKKVIGGVDYKSNFELTVYGSEATITQYVHDNEPGTGQTSATWFLTSTGLIDQTYSLGVVTLTTSYGSETAVAVKDANNYNVLRILTPDGHTNTNTTSSTLHEDETGGTFYRLDLAQSGTLKIWGTNGQSAILLNSLSTSATVAASSTSTSEGWSTWDNLDAGTYYLYNTNLHRFTYTYTTPQIAWTDNLVTVNINDVAISNPNVVSGLPTLTLIGDATIDTAQEGVVADGILQGTWIKGYGSENTAVAIIANDEGTIHIIGPGTTIIKAKAAGGNTDDYIAAYKLIVEGNSVNHTITTSTNTLSFDDVGVLPTGQQTGALTGLTVTYGYTSETSIVTTCNDMTVLKVIDANGYSHPNLTGTGTPPSTIPWEGAAGGTFVKLNATADGYLVVTGNVSADATRIYKWGTTTTTPVLLTPEFDEERHTMSVTLGTNAAGDNYYLYNTYDGGSTYVPPVHSISYVQGFFTNAYEAVRLENISTYTVQTVKGFESPTYTIVETVGNVYDGEHALTVDGSGHITNVAGGGAIHIRATKDAKSVDYYLTVAYPAYPGKLWNFNDGTSIHSITDVPTPPTTSGNWTARYKNSNNTRDARWFYNDAVAGDNGFIIEETAGLIFNTAASGFYMRNDAAIWRHVGIFRQNASFTIPLLKAGDVVELNWKRDAEASGATFSATNVNDLRGKNVNDNFIITGSRNRNRDGVYTDEGGWTSFIVADDGDVTFTMEDNGYNDLLSVRIYSGGYQPTMDPINQYDGGNGVPAPTSILLDNAEQSVTLNYSNPLHGTATGPAMYVLKGYRSGVDNSECVTGKDSQKPGNIFTDEEGYPVSSDEKAELYAQRQYLTGFRMYNESWESANNTYNNGVISASGGYGKVTVRLNNYTQDMKYVIGYTPDYTLTFGSEPHQTYPYTWNFTNISGGAVQDNSNNAYNSVSTDYDTWANLGNSRFGLYTDTRNGSLYIPGATLVAKNNSLGTDEFKGLGFTGELFFQTADGTDDTESTIDGSGTYSLLEYTLTSSNYQDAAIAAENPNAGYWAAGNGFVKFGSTGKRATSAVAYGTTGTDGAAYTMDGGASKNILLKPQRAFRNGDVITFKGYYTAAAASTGSNYGMSFRNEASQSVPYLAAVFIPAGTANNTEVTLTYTVTRGDGIAGLSEVYVFRASSTTLLTAVSVTTTDHSAGATYGKCITTSSSEPLVITVPDLNADSKQEYIYIMSSAAPTDITNATAAVAADGLDAVSGVYKYKVTAPGNCDITFAANTTISRIGVTHIMKQLTTVGEGASAKGWATESRNCAIDYNLTGVFTLNDIDAKYATVSYDVQKATVTLKNIGDYGVPASTGLVLKMESVTNLSSANSAGVPLFAPAISTTTLPAANIGFNGSMGNAMQPNIASRTLTTERENADGTDNASGTFTRFIFATRFMKWKKIGNDITRDATFTEGDVPVFYRLHIYTTTIEGAGGGEAAVLNILGDNKAYLSLHTANIPDALCNSGGGGGAAKPFIPIEGVSDMEEIIDGNNGNEGNQVHNGTYTLSGQRVSDNGNLPPGIYIRNGKKVVVK